VELAFTEELFEEAACGEMVSPGGYWGTSSTAAKISKFGLEETLATTLIRLATRIVAKITAYTYAFLVSRLLGLPQGRIKELWA
jgi:hypothetical protein